MRSYILWYTEKKSSNNNKHILCLLLLLFQHEHYMIEYNYGLLKVWKYVNVYTKYTESTQYILDSNLRSLRLAINTLGISFSVQ